MILDMLEEARDQTLSHLYKALLPYCGSADIPTHATGVIITFAFVGVVRLEQIEPETSLTRVSRLNRSSFHSIHHITTSALGSSRTRFVGSWNFMKRRSKK
jgi:hypothetical protein